MNMQGNQGIGRTAAVLRAVAESNREGLRMTDIAERIGVDKATVHRMLKGMVAAGMLATSSTSRRYHLGPLNYELVSMGTPSFDLKALAESALQILATVTEGTVMLTMREGLDGLCARRVHGPFPIQVMTVNEGIRRPLGVGAGSQALLAALDPAESRSIVFKNRERYEREGMDEELVMTAIEHIRRLGYASQPTAKTSAAWSISLPVVTSIGRPIASISALDIAERMTGEREKFVLAAIRSAKQSIESALMTA